MYMHGLVNSHIPVLWADCMTLQSMGEMSTCKCYISRNLVDTVNVCHGDKEEDRRGALALESGVGDEGSDSLAALHDAEEEKEREVQSGYGKT